LVIVPLSGLWWENTCRYRADWYGFQGAKSSGDIVSSMGRRLNSFASAHSRRTITAVMSLLNALNDGRS